MQLTVKLTEKDVEAFASYHNRTLPQVMEERTRKRKERLRFTAISTAGSLVGSAVTSLVYTNWHAFLGGAVCGVVVGQAWYFFKDKHSLRQRSQQ